MAEELTPIAPIRRGEQTMADGSYPMVKVENKIPETGTGMDPAMAMLMGNQGGMGGGMGGMSMLLPWLFLFSRGGLFGQNGEGAAANAYEVALGQANAQNASFQNMSTQITSGNADISNQITQNALANANYNFQNLSNMQNLAFGLERSTQASFSATQLQEFQNYAALSQQAAQCCCNTQLRIEQTQNALSTQISAVNYESAVRTAAILERVNSGTQQILDKICEDRTQDLQVALQNCQLNSSNSAQTQQIIAAIQAAVNQFIPVISSGIATAVSSASKST
jgi:hypothetical protein